MGIIGDAFSKLFSFLATLFSRLFSAIWEAVKWIGDLLKDLFQFLIDLLIQFIEVIFALVDGLLYLLYMIGFLAVKLFLVIFEAAKILWSLVVGLGNTLASLSYSPRGASGHGYSEIIGIIFSKLDVLQLNSIAYILLFLLWYTTAITAIKLISSIRVGGD